MRLAFATCADHPDGFDDDRPAAALAAADFVVWDDPHVDWEAYDRVVIRSTWDYVNRLDEFVAWAHAVGPRRLRNTPDLVEFNSDKRYLAELSAPTVPTIYVSPGDPLPALNGEFVVKPSISAGGRDTGRFSESSADVARGLIETITSSGRTAMIQPYQSGVDSRGEVAMIYIAGRLSHVAMKRAVLRPDEVAPLLDEQPSAPAAIMAADGFVVTGRADASQQRIGRRVVREVSARFGPPLYLRVDLLPGPSGSPVVVEVEAIEPSLYLSTSPGASQRFAAAALGS